jgi:inorganic pyrophosphatase/manganese-dependent inorganic pyrophosphatase
MRIITGGEKYTDIDLLVCAVAYKELMDLEGIESQIVLRGELNESVPNSLKEKVKDFEIRNTFPKEYNDVVILDVSSPDYISSGINEDEIVEIYDHHFGYEEYWNSKKNVYSKIEPVGSCTTLIFEEYLKRGHEMSQLVVDLFYLTTIVHTLNLQSSVTSQRDIQALDFLKNRTSLTEDSIEKYFTEVEKDIVKNPIKSMTNDTKIMEIGGKRIGIIQLEFWNAKEFLITNYECIKKMLHDMDTDIAFYTSPSIEEGFNYILARDEESVDILNCILDCNEANGYLMTEKLFLRKEIVKKLQDFLN